MQSLLLHPVEIPKHLVETNHMLIASVVIILAEISDGICDVRPSGRHHEYEASDHQWV
jgi:hypothetical protein